MLIRHGNEIKSMEKGCFLENLDANFLHFLKDEGPGLGDVHCIIGYLACSYLITELLLFLAYYLA